MSKKLFEKYIEDAYYDLIYSSILEFYEKNEYSISLKTDNVPEPSEIRLEEIAVEKIRFRDDIFQEETEFKLRVRADFLLKGDKSFDYEYDSSYRKFVVTCNADIVNGLSDFEITDVEEYISDEYKKGLSDFAIPYIPQSDLERRATEFLSKYCKEVLRKPMPLPIDLIIKRMGITLYNAPLGDNVFGKAYFGSAVEDVYIRETEALPFDVHDKTILINPDVINLRSFGSYNNTIIHECVHIEYHSKYFQVKKILDPADNSIVSILGSGSRNLTTDEMKAHALMEWQASALAPRILMPKNTTKIMYEQFLNEEKFFNPDKSTLERLESVINKLAEFFKVSKQAVKLRLIDLGVEDVLGISNYINMKRVPNYSVSKESVKRNQTYIIDFIDSVRQVISNPELSELSKLGKITYVDGFLVINSPEYVSFDNNGNKLLTQYALDHIDECAFAFKKQEAESNNQYYNYHQSMNFMCRPQNKDSYISADYDRNSTSNKKTVKCAFELLDINDSRELSKKLNGVFNEDLLTVITEMGYIHSNREPNYYNIQKLTNVQDKTVKSYVTGSNKNPQKEKLLAICAGLRIHTRVAYHLLEKAGINMNTMKEIDFIYRSLLERHYDEGLDKWNEYLLEANQPTLP
ncbi:MAG: ImmA/IrrE family metallo-endopeptidase [Acholeplasmataceae bacterium]|jgi:hypothetical protein|nr:ImmA/IrrE family metallo-endopeptidase [Acholeplasmataceae bacterium]MDD4824327.1 ImmA/IrrE family metallo-endopeptidase [Acholeplasmataceae bacterium]MDY0339167.1 ImmA/IrrE family metallo-endopeptidase [Acholeplasmataceae bacterium]